MSKDSLEQLRNKLDSRIELLDKNLNRVLEKQEYEYLQAYNIYVKRKEKKLREMIEQQKNSDQVQTQLNTKIK